MPLLNRVCIMKLKDHAEQARRRDLEGLEVEYASEGEVLVKAIVIIAAAFSFIFFTIGYFL